MRCWIMITAGTGPAECHWVVAQLVGVLRQEARAAGVAVELLEEEDGEERRTLRSALLALDGEGAEALARRWEGTTQWVGRSPFRPTHKRKNWFVGVVSMTPPRREEFDPREVTYETFASGGPGGQHANTSDTGVRATHRPTGLSVIARSERSQRMNKKLATAELARRLADRNTGAEDDARRALWSEHHALERGDARHVFRGERFRRDT